MKNEDVAVKVLISITVLPSLLSVLLYFVGVKSYISLIAYGIGLLNLIRLSRLSRKIAVNKKIMFLLCYLFCFICSLYYTISPKISIDKVENIIYTIFIPLCILIGLFRNRINVNDVELLYEKKIRSYSSYILIFFALLLFAGFTEASEDLVGRDCIVGMHDAIWCSRYVGFILLPVIVSFLRDRRINNIEIVGFLCALYIMIQSGSRGPLLSILIVVILLQVLQMKFRYKLLSLFFVLIVYEVFSSFSSRMNNESTLYSNLERIELLEMVLESQFDIIKGVGVGGFAMAVRGEDIYLYPHNIIFETYIEIGIIGSILFFFLLFAIFRKRNNNSIFYIYCFYFFVNSLLSGDISSNNYFFIFSAIILLIPEMNFKTIKKEEIHNSKVYNN